MAKGEFYKMDFRAWNIGTVDLTLEQEGAYLRLCHAMYDVGGPVPNSTRFLQGIFRCGNTKAATLVNQLIAAGKIGVTADGRLINHRVTEELADRERVSAVRRVAGERGGTAPRAKVDRPPSGPRAIPERPTSDTRSNHGKSLFDNDASEAIAPTLRSRGEEIREDQVQATPSPETLARESFPPKAFDQFWLRYPHKVGKDAAAKAFEVRRKSGKVVFPRMMSGLDRYIATKPPDRAWCNPATWLNQGRYDDEPSTSDPRSLRDPSAGAGRGGTSFDVVAAGLARAAAQRGIRPGGRQNGSGQDDSRDRPPRPDDPEVEDAHWTPAGGYQAAHH